MIVTGNSAHVDFCPIHAATYSTSTKNAPIDTATDPQFVRVANEDRQKAEAGDAEAQYSLGRDYQYGYGVPQSVQEAANWYARAANQGWRPAQGALGRMYERGEGLPEDLVKADMWLTLASNEGHTEWAIDRDDLEKKMTPTQIAQAKKLASEWKPTSAGTSTAPAASTPPSGQSTPPPNTSATSHPRIGPV